MFNFLEIIFYSSLIQECLQDIPQGELATLIIPDFEENVLIMFLDFLRGNDIEFKSEQCDKINELINILGIDDYCDIIFSEISSNYSENNDCGLFNNEVEMLKEEKEEAPICFDDTFEQENIQSDPLEMQDDKSGIHQEEDPSQIQTFASGDNSGKLLFNSNVTK